MHQQQQQQQQSAVLHIVDLRLAINTSHRRRPADLVVTHSCLEGPLLALSVCMSAFIALRLPLLLNTQPLAQPEGSLGAGRPPSKLQKKISNSSSPDLFFKPKMHLNPFSAGTPPRTPLGELTTLPQSPTIPPCCLGAPLNTNS